LLSEGGGGMVGSIWKW